MGKILEKIMSTVKIILWKKILGRVARLTCINIDTKNKWWSILNKNKRTMEIDIFKWYVKKISLMTRNSESNSIQLTYDSAANEKTRKQAAPSLKKSKKVQLRARIPVLLPIESKGQESNKKWCKITYLQITFFFILLNSWLLKFIIMVIMEDFRKALFFTRSAIWRNEEYQGFGFYGSLSVCLLCTKSHSTR